MAASSAARHTLELSGPRDEALDAVREAADEWGATWRRSGTAGRIELPVSAGLRYGMLAGEITSQEQGDTTALELAVEEEAYQVHMPALFVIVVGAAGAFAMIFAPLVPGLLTLVPVGLIFMICAWFLVLSRLQHKGPREFFKLVEDIAGEPPRPQDERAP